MKESRRVLMRKLDVSREDNETSACPHIANETRLINTANSRSPEDRNTGAHLNPNGADVAPIELAKELDSAVIYRLRSRNLTLISTGEKEKTEHGNLLGVPPVRVSRV